MCRWCIGTPQARTHFLSASVSSGVRYSAHLSASTAMSIVAMPSGEPATWHSGQGHGSEAGLGKVLGLAGRWYYC